MIKFLLITSLFVNFGTNWGSHSHAIEKFDTEAECRAALKVAEENAQDTYGENRTGFFGGKTKFEGQCKPYYYDK
ncbi:hypothetical protein Aeh1ORF177c [Aeromonas phage Aeh1]|uniref:Uncharacterized protein n=1 Tax=Aeromonas phage Aeh1 TaxID=2880362 RepID=Q76YQ3_9CAUD|nr:hypothetical protein Aeh1p188 [Aeromonas phage Aeh1]AAQ17843.1 hypothetical protein Aeh1ORF177c [Aeromonas phage Aeh1]